MAKTIVTPDQGGTGLDSISTLQNSNAEGADIKSAGPITDGYVLTADGSGGAAWEAGGSSSGDITSVVAGTGLTGGATSGDATVNVVGGDGITAAADEIEVAVDDATIELSASDGSGTVRAKTAAVADSGTALATGDQIYDFVNGGYSASGHTHSTGTVNEGADGRLAFYDGAGTAVNDAANLYWDSTDSYLGIGASPTAALDLRGAFYQFTTDTVATGRATQLQSTLSDAMSVYGLEVRPTHDSSTGDVYGVLGRAVKGTDYSGDVFAVEGYATDAHQANDSTHYGITGDVRAAENSKTGTFNVGCWAIAGNAAVNVGVLIQPNLTDVKPTSGDWAVYAPSSAQDSCFGGALSVGTTVTPSATLDLRGTLYQYSTSTFGTGRVAQLQSTTTDSNTVYALDLRPTHNSSTGDVYGLSARATKGTDYSGNVVSVQGYASDTHQANDSVHYGLVGEAQATENSKTGTTNVGCRTISSDAASNVGVLIHAETTDTIPASGDWAVYAPSATQSSYFGGRVTVKSSSNAEVSTLTDGATITPDLDDANNFSVTLGGNRILANPSNIVAGQSGVITITQDGTGSRTLSYGSYWMFEGGTAPTLTTTAAAVDVLVYYVESATRITTRLIADSK